MDDNPNPNEPADDSSLPVPKMKTREPQVEHKILYEMIKEQAKERITREEQKGLVNGIAEVERITRERELENEMLREQLKHLHCQMAKKKENYKASDRLNEILYEQKDSLEENNAHMKGEIAITELEMMKRRDEERKKKAQERRAQDQRNDDHTLAQL